MSTPFIFVSTHTINEGKLDDFMGQLRLFAEFVEVNEPNLIDFKAFLDDDQTEVSLVFVYPDSDAADHHLQLAGDLIAKGFAITEQARLEVYGQPGPLLERALKGNRERGVPVSVKANAVAEVTRSAAA